MSKQKPTPGKAAWIEARNPSETDHSSSSTTAQIAANGHGRLGAEH